MKFKLLIKKIEGTLNPEEEVRFKKWYWKSPLHRQYFEKVKENYGKDPDPVDIRKSWNDLQNKLENRKKKETHFKWKVAAAILVLIAATSYYNTFNTPATAPEVVEQVIAPGSAKAILTFENGESTVLTKGTEIRNAVMSSDSSSITYTGSSAAPDQEPVFNYLTVPRGGEFFLKLSDGTRVWLNSETKLKYPVQFSAKEPRVVELIYGEAFFEVTHSSENNGNPFQVLTKNQKITVLGTEFNIQAYKKENTFTTLVNGKVRVSTDENLVVLEPGLQSIVGKELFSEDIHVREVDINDVISWKNGSFSFNKMKLEDMMTILSRWYELEVVYENEQKRNLIFSGKLKRSHNINKLLLYLEKTGDLQFEIDEKVLYIK